MRVSTFGVLLLLLVGLQLALGPAVRLSQWRIVPDGNLHWLEARAWLDGRADVGVAAREHALHDGKWYNYLPPLFTLVCTGVLWLERLTIGPAAADHGFDPTLFALLVALPLPLLGFWAFRASIHAALERQTAVSSRASSAASSVGGHAAGDNDLRVDAWAAVLTFSWLAGTPMAVVLAIAGRMGSANHINQLLAQVGLLLIAGDVLGRRRWWPAAIGLVIAAWSRQLTLLYALPLLVLAAAQPRGRRATAVTAVGGAALLAAAGLLAINWVRFGDPLDSGYTHWFDWHADTAHPFASRARAYGMFSVHHLPFNFWYMNLALPSWEWAGDGLRPVRDDPWGASLWFGTPLASLAWIGIRRWWHDAGRRALMAGSILVAFALLCYHNTGAAQYGMFRYALDYLVVWFAVMAPDAMATPRRAWTTLLCTAWSAWYFSLLSP